MAVKMRLQRHGSKKRPFYFIVIADARAPRDGKFIQKLGTYNPLTVPATVQVDRQMALEWLQKGAQPTDTVRRILSFKGVLYLKHLLRGVGLGLFDEAAAMEKFTAWMTEHETAVAKRQGAHKKASQAKRNVPVVKKVEEAPAEEAKAETTEAAPEATAEETVVAPEAAEAVTEEAPAAEAVTEEAPAAEEAKEEAPAAEATEEETKEK